MILPLGLLNELPLGGFYVVYIHSRPHSPCPPGILPGRECGEDAMFMHALRQLIRRRV